MRIDDGYLHHKLHDEGRCKRAGIGSTLKYMPDPFHPKLMQQRAMEFVLLSRGC